MKKVTIEITPKGWDVKLERDGKVYTEKHVGTYYGAKCEGESFEFNEDIDDDLCDVIEDYDPYEIMKYLREISE